MSCVCCVPLCARYGPQEDPFLYPCTSLSVLDNTKLRCYIGAGVGSVLRFTGN